jgi:tRNA threonylcarbamoyladenosine biosynthesis protein TsaE
LRFPSPSPETTREAARLLASAVDERGLVVSLVGPLGAGKTVFVKGLAEGLGVDPALVTSPTFVIASEYPMAGGRRLAHVDLYRVESCEELEAAGFLDLLAPGAVVAVEWGDRLPAALPPDRLQIAISRSESERDPSWRALDAVCYGAVSEAALSSWSAALAERFSRPGCERR